MEKYVLSKEVEITSADVDFDGKLKISALINIFIQASMQSADDLGWGVDNLAQHNLAWVLSSFKVDVVDYPLWRSKVRCVTWAKGTERLFFQRDFKLYDMQGNVLALATSRWLMIDLDRRRPKMLEFDDISILYHNKDKHAIEGSIAIPAFAGETEYELPHTVRYSDVDMNRHMTTTRYIDLMLDTYNFTNKAYCRPKGFTLAFVKEAKYDEQLVMQRATIDGNIYRFQLLSEGQKRASFLGEMRY